MSSKASYPSGLAIPNAQQIFRTYYYTCQSGNETVFIENGLILSEYLVCDLDKKFFKQPGHPQ